jgi:hypothetical protein
MAAVDDLDQVVEQYHLALGEIVKGNPEPLKVMYSHREEVSLANPFGPPPSYVKFVSKGKSKDRSLEMPRPLLPAERSAEDR